MSENNNASSPTGLPDLQCAVCAQRGHGCHFGVVACRPCAAFFRRCIAENRNYKCLRGTNKCDIRKEGHRNACKACRLRLCRLAGMTYSSAIAQQEDKESGNSRGSQSPTAGSSSSTSAVAHAHNNNNGHGHGHGHGPFKSKALMEQLRSNTSPLERQLLEESGAPTLAKIVRAHNAFIAGQRSLFLAMHPDAAFQNFMMIAARIEDNVQMHSGSKPLLFAMLNDGIEPFAEMEHQAKLHLLDECFRQIAMLHACHLTMAEFPHPEDQRYLTNFGHLMDNAQLDLIIGQWAEGTTDPAEYIRIKKPLMEKYFKFICVYKEFSEGVRQQDFCALMAITLWNIAQQKFGEIREEWNEHKEAIFSEWLMDLNSRLGGGGPQASALFMGRLLCTLVELNSLTATMEEATMLFRIFKPEALRTCPDAIVPMAAALKGLLKH